MIDYHLEYVKATKLFTFYEDAILVKFYINLFTFLPFAKTIEVVFVF